LTAKCNRFHFTRDRTVLTPRWHSEFAQGRLSASLAALRSGRDDRFWELERVVVGVVVNREKLREWGHRGAGATDMGGTVMPYCSISY
jgi:hypothetical protein